MSRTPVGRWWADLPLRSRLTLVAAVPVALAIGIAVTVAYAETRHELRGQIDSQLRHQASELQQQAAFFQGQGFPVVGLHAEFGQPGGYVQVVRSDGLVNQPNEQPALPVRNRDEVVAVGQSNGGFRDTHVGDVSVRMLTTQLAVVGGTGYAVQVALPLTAVNAQLHRLTVAYSLLAASALAVAIFLAWFLTRRALSPVARLTETAEEIAATKDLTYRIGVASDDELGRLAASFNSMLDALDRSLAAQRQLVTDASHELRTPLASLRTNAEVLRDFNRLGPAEREAVIAGIVSQVDELTTLVADVVELARGDEPPHHIEPVEFDALVERAVAQARRHWPHVRFDLETAPVVVSGVPQRLERAVANLLDNAGKFSPAGSSVQVSLNAEGRLSVRDHGPGISDDALPNVFERFYRADEARSLPGSGLGLAIVQQVAASHGGEVRLRNAEGGGVLAELSLPITGEPSDELQVSQPSSATNPSTV
ncbi:MAG: sensor histidine kinase [Actinomycetes bacterium]